MILNLHYNTWQTHADQRLEVI